MQKKENEGSLLSVCEGVEGKKLRSIVNLEVGEHSYSEFANHKIYHSGALNATWIITSRCPYRRVVPLACVVIVH
jgi:hypothetical protein